MNLTFHIPMPYCSLPHWTLLPSPVTYTAGCCCGSISSFFLDIFLHSSSVAYWAPTDLGSSSFSVLSFAFSYCSWGSQGKNTEVACHSLLQQTTFCQNSPPWPVLLGWPHTAWLIVAELDKAVVLFFLWLLFSFCLLSWEIRIRGLWKLPNGRDWLWGKLGLVLMGRAMLSKSLTQFSVDGQCCVPSLLLTWDQSMVEVMEIMATSFRRPCAHTATLSAPDPAAGTADPHRCQRLLDTHRYLLVSGSWGKSSQSVINH